MRIAEFKHVDSTPNKKKYEEIQNKVEKNKFK